VAERFGLKVLGEAADGLQALNVLRKVKPDIAMVDLQLPKLSGIDVIAKIHQDIPNVKLVALTGMNHGEYVENAIAAGVCAYLTKPVDFDEFPRILSDILQNRHYLSARAVDHLWNFYGEGGALESVSLSRRQREIVGQVSNGLSNKEISARLGISVRTVEKYRAQAMARLGAGSAAELGRYANKLGLVDSDAGA
jgi:two-component system, NarL family, response regulator NreC